MIPLLALAGICLAAGPTWTPNAQQLLDQSMNFMDTFYDEPAGYLYNLDREAALRHETRSSAWYAFGLLARGAPSDLVEADRIIRNVISGQFTEPEKQWYGTYQKYPEEPEVGTKAYPAEIYDSWDPNWRGFVGTTFVVMLEEYEDSLSEETRGLMMESLHHAVVGDTYRVGGVDDDNLYPAYSNPAIMRAFVSGWMGRRASDENMTTSGESYAREIIALFNETETLSEFNSGTYTGVSLFGLALWSTYLPPDSIMAQMGPVMLRKTWEAVAGLWHPGMKNMAGPWDRAYGFDMNRYLSVMALWFWAYLGKESSSVIQHPQMMSHAADYAWAPLIAAISGPAAAFLPNNFFDRLKSFKEERTFEAQAWYPPYDLEMRNVTTWLSEWLTIGGMSYNQTQEGGAAENADSFTPGVVQWVVGDEIGFLTLRPTEKALQSSVSPNKLNLTYPTGDSSSVFTLALSTFTTKPTITTFQDIPGMRVAVSGNVNPQYTLSFSGKNGGVGEVVNTFEFWNVTFEMPGEFDGPPNLVLEFEML